MEPLRKARPAERLYTVNAKFCWRHAIGLYDGWCCRSQESLGVEHPFSYDEQLKKHSWKMEIQGDPFNLKSVNFMQ